LTDNNAPALDYQNESKKGKDEPLRDLENPDAPTETTFSFKDNKSEINEGFFNNLGAVIYSKFNNYKRNKHALFNDAVLPAILLTLGIGLS